MIGINYADELFAVVRIPGKFWEVIQEDLRYDGWLRSLEGFVVLVLPALIVSSIVVRFSIVLEKQFYSLLIAAATLFVGFSMNSILLLLKYSNEEDASKLLIDQTRNLITYLLYLGVALAGTGIVGYVITSQEHLQIELASTVISTLSIFVLTHFLVVVLFLPARIFTIIEGST